MVSLTQLNRAIIENVAWNDDGVNLSGSNIYFAQCSWSDNMGGERESVVLGTEGETITNATANGANLTLSAESKAGTAAFVLDGVSMGEHRRITAWNEQTATLDAPFSAADETEMTVAIGQPNENVYFSELELYNTGAIRLQGLCANVVVDSAKLKRSSGITAVSSERTLNWYVSVVGSQVSDSEWFKYYGLADGENRCTSISLIGNRAGATLGIALRCNELQQGAFIELKSADMQNVLLQNNSTDGAAIAVEKMSGECLWNGVLLADNSYNNVKAIHNFEKGLLSEKNDFGNTCLLILERQTLWLWWLGAGVVLVLIAGGISLVFRKASKQKNKKDTVAKG